MARSRSPHTTVKDAPPPADGLRDDLDRLANRVVLRLLGVSPQGVSEPQLELQISGLKAVASYWGLTRKGLGGSTDSEHKSAYQSYREMIAEEDVEHGKAH